MSSMTPILIAAGPAQLTEAESNIASVENPNLVSMSLPFLF
jgi:hypothetical protein